MLHFYCQYHNFNTARSVPNFQYLRQQPTLVAADASALLAHTFADGKGFPPSYIDFATELG